MRVNSAPLFVRRIYGAVVPSRMRSALHWYGLSRRARSKPFPFIVAAPQFQRTLNCCVAYNKYGAYCVPVSGLQRPAALSVLAGEVWEAPTIELMTAQAQAGDIIHAGTFFGDFLPALAAACASSNNKIWAFEPNPESYQCAVITLLLNQISNVELINAGLGERQDSGQLVTSQRGRTLGGASYLLQDLNDCQRSTDSPTIQVRIISIDDVIPGDRLVSAIQLDIEGYEERALTGAMRTIRKNRPLLILETLPTKEWLTENLYPLGYQIAESFMENTVIRPQRLE
jgi:FkbM family methyltransferase